jgi:hypothetical protein
VIELHRRRNQHPAIRFEDGTWYRAESREMKTRIRDGRLFADPG